MKHPGILGPALALWVSGELEKDDEYLEIKWEQAVRKQLMTNPGHCILPEHLWTEH